MGDTALWTAPVQGEGGGTWTSGESPGRLLNIGGAEDPLLRGRAA